MPPPVQVEPERLRAAAQRLRQLAPTADGLPEDVERTATEAKDANDGFLTADVCEEFAERTTATAKTIGEHVAAMAGPIEESAQAWDDADVENGGDIERCGADLDTATV